MENLSQAFLTTKQAADSLGLTDQAIRRAIWEKRILAQKVGRLGYLISKADFNRFRDARNRKGRTDEQLIESHQRYWRRNEARLKLKHKNMDDFVLSQMKRKGDD